MKKIIAAKAEEVSPESIQQDAKISAAMKALDVELNRLVLSVDEVLHLPRLDYLSDEVLDHLAWQYHVDFYSSI